MAAITFNGASGTVTGSSYILQSDSGKSLMIDFGMYQGTEDIVKLNYDEIEIDIDALSGVILTHAHLDHVGRMPILTKRGYRGKVYMTQATRVLAELVLYDAAKIARMEEGIKQLYTGEDVAKFLSQAVVVDYRQPFEVGEFSVMLRDAGHILGSSSVEIITGGKKVVFSGDLGNSPQQIEAPTDAPDSADVVVMESTYGGRFHTDEDPLTAMDEEINAIEKNAGTLLIPSFSIERAQAILLLIGKLKKDKRIRYDTNVYLDSPMASSATDIYREYTRYFNKSLKSQADISDPFSFPGLIETASHRESMRIHRDKGAKVIIAGAGMMTGGRILHHAKRFLSDARNRLLFVGYQGEETLGREILEGGRNVNVDGKSVIIRASISETAAMSAHADHGQLVSWVKGIKGVKKLFLTHGEDIAREPLQADLNKEGFSDVVLPSLYDTHSF